MNKTSLKPVDASSITTDLTGLTKLLGCGEATARTIGRKAEARVKTDSRRTLYFVEKIRKYCENHSY